jgi:adenylosuccinate synthase
MANVVVVGAQWGDEGKGKVVDCLTEMADAVARFQGGHNAGHTVVINDRQFILHIVPSGILHPDKLSIIGNGVVVEPGAMIEEINGLRKSGIRIDDNLRISKTAHVIMPHHIAIDQQKEVKRGNKKIGTTGRGIGPAYVDKIARSGIRMVDLLWPEVFRDKLFFCLDEYNSILKNMLGADELDGDAIYDTYMGYADVLKTYIDDTDVIVNDLIEKGKNVLFEGAQGTLLDIDHGTYPYVTSSNASAGGACTGLGVGPTKIHAVLGVVKAYTTRVGSGPFPTELHDKLGEDIRAKGGEFGATTGRPRRCGWLDFVALKHSVRVNGLTGIILTKLDILDELPSLKICTGYRYNGGMIKDFPKELQVLEKCEPVYEEVPGWQASTIGIREFGKLPRKARDYIRLIEDTLKVPVEIISTGQKRDQLITLKSHF